ncbi:MAG: hypothetical protein V1721_10455 [Pseudomonadota bacterium]
MTFQEPASPITSDREFIGNLWFVWLKKRDIRFCLSAARREPDAAFSFFRYGPETLRRCIAGPPSRPNTPSCSGVCIKTGGYYERK